MEKGIQIFNQARNLLKIKKIWGGQTNFGVKTLLITFLGGKQFCWTKMFGSQHFFGTINVQESTIFLHNKLVGKKSSGSNILRASLMERSACY